MKHLAHRIGCFILPKYMMKSYTAAQSEDDKDAKVVPSQITQYFESIRSRFRLDHPAEATSDFFGILKDVELETKKQLALDTYKLIFRFSIEKLTNFLEDDSFILLLLQYVKET